ncbi:hypothetical protein DASC09_024240 [Saccharomycopsis crataegensis]|uniref:Methyltransferase domain-containing protein n=1 Tax=Saccharomycopsis crataegensis TaxID=43959 RepID=A0AAV5QKY5_9ASCO|nr:hypothetical protein DASC09_024240 [Saccharomycopsis crataegensis]
MGLNDQSYYASGYDPTVSKTHSWRTVATCCEYFEKSIKLGDTILDVGCGPGTITCDFARYVGKDGEVIGIEPTKELIDEANLRKPSELDKNVKFSVASAYKIPFDDNTFDIVHCHQVLVHLEDPLAALKEMKRVCKKGGVVCCREADLEMTAVYPLAYIDTVEYYFRRKSTDQTSTDGRMGRKLRSLAMMAGFDGPNVNGSVGNWTYYRDDERKWFGEMFLGRIGGSKEKFIYDSDVLNDKKKAEIIRGWEEWIKDPDGWLNFSHGQIVCRKADL